MIIDIHMHLGDILHHQGGKAIYGKTPLRMGLNIQWFEESILKFNSFRFTDFLFDTFDDCYTLSVQNRIKAGNLRNFEIYHSFLSKCSSEMFGDSFVKSCCMPVGPYVSYADIEEVSVVHDSVLPFTTINPELDDNEICDQISKQGRMSSCYGLKLHPIIQKIAFDSDITFSALESFQSSNKPVLFHAGASRYYLGAEKRLQDCSLDNPTAAKRLIDNFRNIRFIIGHAGIREFKKWADLFRHYENVFFDITVQSANSIRELIKMYGEDRMLFATDWPCVNPTVTMEIVQKALKENQFEKCFYKNAISVLNLN